MKLNRILLVLALVALLSTPQVASANMAAPDESDVGSVITFEKSDAISVLSEHLIITVNGETADITAIYTMRNTTDETVTTPSMFLSPNMETGNTRVTVNGEKAAFTAESHRLTRSISTDGWQYVISNSAELSASSDSRSVDTITFEMTFAPREEFDVKVAYTYRLGGYPTKNFNVKRGEIEYLLTPASMWKDFEDLTIDLILDEDMPVLKHSNLDFEKIGRRVYRYTSNTLPDEDLSLTIDENWFQNIFSTLRSPYLGMTLMLFSPLILIAVIIVIVVIVAVRRKRKNKREHLTP